MDQSSEVANFEEYLKKNSRKKRIPLYSNNKQVYETVCEPKDVLLNVSTQIKAIQSADNMKCERKLQKNIYRYRSSGFVLVNELPVDEEVPKQCTPASKFDTECVTDTQLFNIIQDAEARNTHKGMTQEFDSSFSHTESVLKDTIVNNQEDLNPKNFENDKIFIDKDFNSVNAAIQQDKDTIKDDKTNEIIGNYINTQTHDTLTELLSNEINVEDSERPLSPILNHMKPIIKCSKPLVYTLKSFEEFEKIAIPLMDENMNMDKAKHLINSQLLDNELYLHKDLGFQFEQLSPVLEIKKEKDKKNDIAKEKSNKPVTSEVHNNSLEDEILFSSDEEIDYNHKELQDLPFTCALETSFYNTSNVLDKTMFVGFQTASNKSIQINSDSFTNAQSILSDFDEHFKRDPTLTELVEAFNDAKYANEPSKIDSIVNVLERGFDEHKIMSDNHNYPKDDTNKNPVEILQTKELIPYVKQMPLNINSIVTDFDKKTSKRNCEEFSTSSTKRIKLSEQALTMFKNVYQDIHFDKVLESQAKREMFANNEERISPEINVKASKNELNLGDKEVDNLVQDKINDDLIIQEFENIEMSLEENKSIVEENFAGFKTASKKNIIISDDAVKTCQHIFQDIDFSEQMDEDLSKDGIQYKDNDKFIRNNINDASKKETAPQFSGFITASNKQIKISEQALFNTVNIFKDLDYTNETPNNISMEYKQVTETPKINYNEPSTSRGVLGGFKTANNKDIKISKDALAKTKNVFKDIDNDEHTQIKNNDTYDFKDRTPNNISIESKQEKLKKTNYNQPSTSQATFGGFKTANNKDIEISKDALAKTKNIFKDIDNEEHPQLKNKDTHDFKEFKTDNKKLANITDEELVQRKILCQDKDIFNQISSTKKPDVVSRKSNEKTVNILEDDLISRKLFKDLDVINNMADPPVFQGFKTASNKIVKISTEALAKTSKIFQDIDNNCEKPVKTGNGDVKIREDDAALRNILFQDVDSTNISKEFTSAFENKVDNAVTMFQGFKTASNKSVKISDQALQRSKKLFQDIDSSDVVPLESKSSSKNESNLVTQGFKTASNKAVNVSEKALLKSKKVFNDIDIISEETHFNNKSNNTNEINFPFQGFKTANNKAVKISEEALLKSKKVFNDIDVINEETPFNNKSNDTNETNFAFQGFKTASDKAVKVSDEALLQCKKLFQDMDSIQLESKDKPQKAFKGFMTANNKTVKVDDQALAKSKKLFEDIDLDIKNETAITNFEGFKTGSNKTVEISEKVLATSIKVIEDVGCSQILNMGVAKGFQTANKKRVNISEDALIKSKKLFQDIDLGMPKYENAESGLKTVNNIESEELLNIFAEIDNGNKIDTKPKCDIVGMIDTQVMNDFEETVYTEDFRNSPTRNKRSGSPILSCPRAKKRRFETPYRTKEISKVVAKTNEVIISNNPGNFKFDANYKKYKRYTLKDLLKLEDFSNSNTEKHVLSYNFDNLLEFEFKNARNDIGDHILTIKELKDIFIESVNKNFIPKGWIENHLQLIIWKLISYEIKFPNTMINICTAKNVIDQLKYRYDMELYDARRPVLRKILEKDDTSMRTMVLCVVNIFVDGVNAESVTNTTNNIELLLTDGWYCVKATIDKMLSKLVCDEKIVVGTKIVTNGAELMNCEQGIAPWEDTSSVRLKIFGNSTRRARWDARLGCHGNAAMLTHLSSVKLDGGKVSKLIVLVTRVYPTLYVEKFEDGSTVTRSERLEHLYQIKYEAERQVLMEKLYEEVEKEFADQDSQNSEGSFDESVKRSCLDSGSQIAMKMKKNKDPMEFKNNLTHTQHALLNQYTNAHRERLLEDIQGRIRKKMTKSGLCANRNIVPVMKVRVAGVEDRSGVEVTKGMISIWKPNDSVQEIIREGAWIDVLNVVPTAIRYSEIQISAGRQSVFSISKYKEKEKVKPYTKLLKRTCYLIKDLATNPTSTTDYNEIDTVGMVFSIDPSIKDFESMKGQTFQNVYIADADKNIICINFWGGLKKFGFENVLDTGQIVSCTNLQKRAGNTRRNIPQYRVTEFTYFTKAPKNEAAKKIMDELNKKLLGLDKRKFCEDCIVLRNNFTICKVQNNENISPYRLNNSDYNISKHRMFIDTPKRIEDFNLTGLDFESTFKQTESQDLSPNSLDRKRRVNEKISKLRMYGEPPPLSKIHIINKSKNASSSYKSPLISKSDVSYNVGSIENNPENCPKTAISRNNSRNACSPIISMNNTYVKRSSVNPVKLNFSNSVAIEENGFADEFDCSPPLSFD